MKRTEMIDIIIDEICNNEPISRENKNIEFAAEWILKRIEKAGMLPPFNEPYMDRSLGESFLDIKNYKWEKEK